MVLATIIIIFTIIYGIHLLSIGIYFVIIEMTESEYDIFDTMKIEFAEFNKRLLIPFYWISKLK